MTKREQLGRLAMRVEGTWWVAYYALVDSMEDAAELGRIRMALAGNLERRQAFVALMCDCVADILEETTGQRPDCLVPQAAPESERSGAA